MGRGPSIGDVAPDFVLPDQHGRPTSLSGALRPTLIVFIPAAFTPVCHGELRDLAELRRGVSAATMGLVAISCDSMFVLRSLDESEQLGLPLLSDFWPHGEVARRYDSFNDATGLPERASFLVDAAGIVRETWRSAPDRPREADAYRRAWEALLPRP